MKAAPDGTQRVSKQTRPWFYVRNKNDFSSFVSGLYL